MTRWKSAPQFALVATLALLAASCTAIPAPEAPPAAPPQEAAPAPRPVATPALPWDQRALDNGAWRYDAGTRTAAFLQSGNPNPLVALTCIGSGIRLSAGLAAAGQSIDVMLLTSAGADRLRFDGTGMTFPANDGRLDRIAFSRGRFALEASNGRALTLPVQSEIGRVIEDCR